MLTATYPFNSTTEGLPYEQAKEELQRNVKGGKFKLPAGL